MLWSEEPKLAGSTYRRNRQRNAASGLWVSKNVGRRHSRRYPDICQHLVTLYEEEPLEGNVTSRLNCSVKSICICAVLANLSSNDIAPTAGILCKSELPLQTADNTVLKRPRCLCKKKKKRKKKEKKEKRLNELQTKC